MAVKHERHTKLVITKEPANIINIRLKTLTPVASQASVVMHGHRKKVITKGI